MVDIFCDNSYVWWELFDVGGVPAGLPERVDTGFPDLHDLQRTKATPYLALQSVTDMCAGARPSLRLHKSVRGPEQLQIAQVSLWPPRESSARASLALTRKRSFVAVMLSSKSTISIYIYMDIYININTYIHMCILKTKQNTRTQKQQNQKVGGVQNMPITHI